MEPDSNDSPRALPVDHPDYLRTFWSNNDRLDLELLSVPGTSPQKSADLSRSVPTREKSKMGTKKKDIRRQHENANVKLLQSTAVKDVIRTLPPGVTPKALAQGIRRLAPQLSPVHRKDREEAAHAVSAAEKSARIEALSQPFTDKSKTDFLPPKLSTDSPELSFQCVEELQQRGVVGQFEYEAVSDNINKIRLDISAVQTEEWEYGERHAFQDLLFANKRCVFRPKREFDIEGENNGLQQLWSRLDYKKSKLETLEYASFMRNFCAGFFFLVFDMKLQVIGTYDLFSGFTMSGIQLCPHDLNRRKERSKTRANLAELHLSELPAHVFALVPVLYDEAEEILPPVAFVMTLSVGWPSGEWSSVSDRLSQFVAVRGAQPQQPLPAAFTSSEARFTAVRAVGCVVSI